MKSGNDRSTKTKGSHATPKFGGDGCDKLKAKANNPGYGKGGPRSVAAAEGKCGS